MSSQEKTFRDLKNREAPLTAIGSLQPRVQGLPQLWRPTWKHPLGPRTHQLLEASAHRLGGLDGVEKPFPLCVTCHPFLSPGQVAVYPHPPNPKGPPRAELCHRRSAPPLSDPTSVLLPCSFLFHRLSCMSRPFTPLPGAWIWGPVPAADEGTAAGGCAPTYT